MDEQRFDRFARAVAGSGSRRGALRALAGGVMGVGLAAVGLRRAAAEGGCRERFEVCSSRGQCCEAAAGITCRTLSQDCGNRTTPRRCCGLRGARCSGNCDCCRDFTCEDSRCVARPSDPPA